MYTHTHIIVCLYTYKIVVLLYASSTNAPKDHCSTLWGTLTSAMFDWDEVPENLGGPNKAALEIEAEVLLGCQKLRKTGGLNKAIWEFPEKGVPPSHHPL